MRALYVLTAVVVVAALLLTVIGVFQRQLIYFPRLVTGRARHRGDAGRDVTLKTSDGLELGAWYLPAGQAGRGVTVLVASGNAGNRSLRARSGAVRAAVRPSRLQRHSGDAH